MKYQEIKTESQSKMDALITECSVFFAFSNEQFVENKTPLQDGEKYVRLFGGGFIPRSQVKAFTEGLKEINRWERLQIKKAKEQTAQILYELSNHECWHTGDIENALPVLNHYPVAIVQKVFNENYKEYSQTF